MNCCGFAVTQFGSDSDGVVDDSVISHLVTDTLSDELNVVTDTVNEFDVAGRSKAVTVGATASASVIVIAALNELDTFPAASFAHAYRVT